MSVHKSSHCETTLPSSLFAGKESDLWNCEPHEDHKGFKIENPALWSVVYDKKCLQSAENQTEVARDQLCLVKVGGFFMGFLSHEPGGLKLTVTFDKFDPGIRTKSGILCPTNLCRNAFVSPLLIINDVLLGTDHAPYLSMIDEIIKYKNIYDQMKFNNRNGTNHLPQPRLSTLYCKTATNGSVVKFITLGTTSQCNLSPLPIEPIPIIHTALVKSFKNVCDNWKRSILSGFLTKDQNGNLMLLLDTDPKIFQLPIVGIWLEGIETIHHPLIWLKCLRYMNSQLFSQSASDKSFLLVIYMDAQPSYYYCTCSTSTMTEFSLFSSECYNVDIVSGGSLEMDIKTVKENFNMLDLIATLLKAVGQLCLDSKGLQKENSSLQLHVVQNKSETQYLYPSVPEPSLLLQETVQTYKKGSNHSDELFASKPISLKLTNLSEKTDSKECENHPFLQKKESVNEEMEDQLIPINTGSCSGLNIKETVTCGTQTDLVPIGKNDQLKESTTLSCFSNETTNQEDEFNSCPSVCTSLTDNKSCVLSLSLGASASTCKKPAKQDDTTSDEFLVETLNQLNAVLCKPNQKLYTDDNSSIDTTIQEDACARLESSTPELDFVSLLNENGLLKVNEVDSLTHSQSASELSMHANAIALKYLTDDQFPEFKDILKKSKQPLCQSKGNLAVLDPVGNSISPSNVSLATQKYLQKYGLTNLTLYGQKQDDDLSKPPRKMNRQISNSTEKDFLQLDNFPNANGKAKAVKNGDLNEGSWTQSGAECLSDDLEKSVGDTVNEILHPKMLQTLNKAENNWITHRSQKSLDRIQKNLSSSSETHLHDRRRSNSTGRILSSQFLHLLAEKQTRRMSTSPKFTRKNLTGGDQHF